MPQISVLIRFAMDEMRSKSLRDITICFIMVDPTNIYNVKDYW